MHAKIAILTHTPCLNEGKIFSWGHACITSNMQTLYELNIIMMRILTMQFTISSVQDACLEHAEVLGALQNFEIYILPPFPIFKNIAINT